MNRFTATLVAAATLLLCATGDAAAQCAFDIVKAKGIKASEAREFKRPLPGIDQRPISSIL